MDAQAGLDRRTFFKGAGLVGATLAAPTLLAGCGGDGGSGAAGGAERLEFWWNPSVESADQMTAWMDGVVKEFMAANKGATIESTTQPSEQLASNFRTAASPSPDRTCSTSTPAPTRCSSSGRTASPRWTRTLDAEEIKHVLPPAGAGHLQVQGQDLGAAWYNAPIPLMYNKALFRKAGLDPEKPPATMDEMMTGRSGAPEDRGHAVGLWR